MKVRWIRSEKLQFGTDDLEEKINNFIKNKKVIDIKYQEYSDEYGVSANVLIIYEED